MKISFLRGMREYYATRPFYIFLSEYFMGLVIFFIFIEGVNFFYVSLFSLEEYSRFMMFLDTLLISLFWIFLGIFGDIYILSSLKNITNFYFWLQFLNTNKDLKPESVYNSDNLLKTIILGIIIQMLIFIVVNPLSFNILERVYIPSEKLPTYIDTEKKIVKIKNAGIDLNSTKYTFAKEQNLSSGYVNIIQKKKVSKRGIRGIFDKFNIVQRYFKFLALWLAAMFIVMMIHHKLSSKFIRD